MPCCGKPARRETGHHGHLRGFVLVLHALLRRQEQRKMVAEAHHYWMPMDQYIGGIDQARHPAPAVRALLESR